MERSCDGRMREEEGFQSTFEYSFENLAGAKQLKKTGQRRGGLKRFNDLGKSHC